MTAQDPDQLDLEGAAKRLIAFYDEPIDGSLVGGSAQAAEFMEIVDGIRTALASTRTPAGSDEEVGA